MPFIKIPNFKGLVYVPESGRPRKHDCPDCFYCQECSDERCEQCLKRGCGECGTGDHPDRKDCHE